MVCHEEVSERIIYSSDKAGEYGLEYVMQGKNNLDNKLESPKRDS